MTADVAHLRTTVPESLRTCPQWVLWKIIERDGKPSKMPLDAKTGMPASSVDPSTWASFDVALDACRKFASIAGVGFVFTADDPFCGIDLDDCIVDGKIVPEAQAIIDTFNTYTEISPSERGVKLIGKARKPKGAGCKSTRIDGFKEIEIYDERRFFTITGRRVWATPTLAVDCQEAIDGLCGRLWPPKPSPSSTPPGSSGGFDGPDDELVKLAIASRNGDRFERLLNGDLSGYDNDHSRADLALCNMLAFWTGRDADRMDRIFRGSGLYREKWEREDYRSWTIGKAIESCTEVFEPGSDSQGVNIDRIMRSPQVKPGADHEPDERWISTLTSDVGNAARLVRRFGDDIRYCHGTGQWLVWDGKRWKPDRRGHIVKLCKATALLIYDEAREADDDDRERLTKWALTSQKRERLTAMAALAQPEVAVSAEELDADPWALNCHNGTIDLRTGELRPHRKEDLITKLARAKYEPRALSPRFRKFIHEIFKGDYELTRFVQRWHGHCLTGDIREQYLPIYHGEGNNGKSVLLDTISLVMGDYAGEAPPDLITVRKNPEHPTEIADMLGKRLVIASETEEGAELRLQLIKRLTGNARLKARMMRQDYFEFPRTHKMILVTNNRPTIKEDTEAAWRRLRLVPFDVVIPKEKRDTNLMRKLKDEKAGILAWLVEGCVDWLREGLTEPEAVIAATQAYRGTANGLDAFLAECCTFADGLVCRSSELMAAYDEWCDRNRKRPLRGRAFAAVLKERGVIPMKMSGQRHWVGLALEGEQPGHNGRIGRIVPVNPFVGENPRSIGT